MGFRTEQLGVEAGDALTPLPSPPTILPFTPRHYPAFTALWNQAYPDLTRSELELRLADMSRGAEAQCRRWVAESNDRAIAFCSHEPFTGEVIDPGKCQLHLFVSPEFRQQGIGGALYDEALNSLSTNKAELLRAWVREDHNETISFLSQRGFAEEMATFHSLLDVASFNLARLDRYARRLEKYGYRFRSFQELYCDPERNRKAFELYCSVLSDIPSPGPRQLPSFAEYDQKIAQAPEWFRAQFFALHGEDYVGICILLPTSRTRRELYADTLGVKGNYRGRGIAQALSRSGIEYAQQHGYATISADSFVANQRIAAVLESLGFGNRMGWTLMAKSLG